MALFWKDHIEISAKLVWGFTFKSTMFARFSSRSGFSLFELIVALGILLLIAAAAAPNLSSLFTGSQMSETAAQMTQTLRMARERSLAHHNNSPHGVYFEINPLTSDKYILYQGSSYGARDPNYDRVIELSKSISLGTTFGGDISFSKGLGTPSVTGTVTLSHIAEESRTIVINAIGFVEEN